MTNLTANQGDTVTATLTGVVTRVRDNFVEFTDQNGRFRAVDQNAITKVVSTLPNKPGTVLRVLYWYGNSHCNWTVLRTRTGWQFSVDAAGCEYTDADLRSRIDNGNIKFEVLFTPEG